MAGLGATLVVAACGGHHEPLSDRVIPLPTEAPPVPPTPSVPSFGFDDATVQKVWAEYQAASGALDAISEDSNPEDPRLSEWFTGPVLAHWQNELSERNVAGQRVAYPPDSRHREELKGVLSLSADTAEIDICALDDAVVSGPDGEVIDDDVAVRRAVVTLRLEGERWKWADQRSHDATESECPGFFDSSPSPTTASVMRDTTLAS